MQNEALIDNVDRTGLLDLSANPNKRYALFVRGGNASSAKFKFAFETQEEAINKANEYASQRVANGHHDFTFYVVHIKNRIGIEGGKLVNES